MTTKLIMYVDLCRDAPRSQVFCSTVLAGILASTSYAQTPRKLNAFFACHLYPTPQIFIDNKYINLSLVENPFFFAALSSDPLDIEDGNKVKKLAHQFVSKSSLEEVICESTSGNSILGEDDIFVVLAHGSGSTIGTFRTALSQLIHSSSNPVVESTFAIDAVDQLVTLLTLQAISFGLTPCDIADALGQNKPGLIILHSCYSGTLEFAFGLRDSAKYLLASPANLLVSDIAYREWFDGSYLNVPPDDAKASGIHLVNLTRTNNNKSELLALYDLSKFDDLKNVLNNFVKTAKTFLEKGQIQVAELVCAMNECYQFAITNTTLQAIDLHQFGKKVASIELLKNVAAELCNAAQECVITHTDDSSVRDYPDEIIGLSIVQPIERFLPDPSLMERSFLENAFQKIHFPFAISTGWLSLLQHGVSG